MTEAAQPPATAREAPTSQSPATMPLSERLAAATALLLYVVVVSRAEFLPLPPGVWPLLAAALTLLLIGLLAWRLAAWLRPALIAPTLRVWLPPLLVLGVAITLRLTIGGPAEPATPAELRVVRLALQIVETDPLEPALWPEVALAWLHAPIVAARYVAGVSSGLWQFFRDVTLAHLLGWSRAWQLVFSLATVGLTGLAGWRLAGRWSGLVAASLLATAGPSILLSQRIDPLVQLALILAGGLALLSSRPARRWLTPRPAGWLPRAIGLLAVLGLWLPSLAGLAPALALLAGLGLTAGQRRQPPTT